MKAMKNIFKFSYSLALGISLSWGMTSCDDWLNLEPENSVTAQNYWMSASDVSSAMTGIYCAWLDSYNNLWEQSEMRGDIVTTGYTLKSDYQLVRQGNITSSNSLVKWEKYYSVINKCNLLLDRSYLALKNDPAYTVTQDSIYHAEARVVRSMMYFYLIRIWKDVPYVTESYYDDTRDRYPEVSKQMDILDACIADLEAIQAESFLPYSYSQTEEGRAQNKGRVTMYMLKALLADMYRMKGSYATDRTVSQDCYQKCVALCNTIIESGQFALVPFTKNSATENHLEDNQEIKSYADTCFYDFASSDQGAELFSTLFGNGNSVESIMELQEDSYNSSHLYGMLIGTLNYIPNLDNLNNVLFPPTEKEIALTARYQDVRKTYSYGTLNGKACIAKFAFYNFTTFANTVTEFKKNISVYRLAEIYLMKAEALTQLAMANGNDQETLLEAYRAIFKVRDRACAVETTDVQLSSGDYMQDRYWFELRKNLPISLNPNDLDPSRLEKLVLDEEARELMFEGRRWFDLLRNAERNAEGKGACTGGNIAYLLNVAGSCTDIDKVSYIVGQFRKPDFRYLPYPYNDVSLNKNLSQKPFWGVE